MEGRDLKMGATIIQWTDHSINPIRARDRRTKKVGHYCEKVSAGCTNCYSSRMQVRFGTPGFGSGQHREHMEIFLDDGKLREVIGRKRPTKFFWCDMTDLFGSWVNDQMIDRCFAAMALTPHHTHQVLTKRPARMREYLTDPNTPRRVAEWMAGGAMMQAAYRDYVPPWPIPSVWCGVSVENQAAADERIPLLLQTPAAIRFLSCEPLLGPVELKRWLWEFDPAASSDIGAMIDTPSGKLHWVIVGGESGPGSRAMQIEWARELVRQCKAADVAVFCKQLGATCTASYYDTELREFVEEERHIDWPDPIGWNYRDGQPPIDARIELPMADKKGGEPEEWPEDLRIRQFPTARAAA
jgi:protein gp37